MRTPGHGIHHLVRLVGTALVLVSLFGCLALVAGTAAGVEPTAYREYWDYPDRREYRDYHGYREDRWYRKPRYEPPDRFTIHKGRKCEVRCERIWGTRDYQCREYRC